MDIVYNHAIIVKPDKENHRSIAMDKDMIIGECDYTEDDDSINIYHTEVNGEYGGKGIAKRLVYKILEYTDTSELGVANGVMI